MGLFVDAKPIQAAKLYPLIRLSETETSFNQSSALCIEKVIPSEVHHESAVVDTVSLNF